LPLSLIPPPPAPCACACRDIEERPRFLVGVQVDVTEHPTAAEATPVGMQAANAVGQALQNMNWWVGGRQGGGVGGREGSAAGSPARLRPCLWRD
jgi:hypothetical protein